MTQPLKFQRTIQERHTLNGGKFTEYGTRVTIAMLSTLDERAAAKYGRSLAVHQMTQDHAERFARNLYGDVPGRVAVVRAIIDGWVATMPGPPPGALAEALRLLELAQRELDAAVAGIRNAVENPAHVTILDPVIPEELIGYYVDHYTID